MSTEDMKRSSQDSGSKPGVEVEEVRHVERRGGLSESDLHTLRQRYPLLANASQEKLDQLNKAVLRKLDWRFLPVITAMLLMR